MFQYVSQIFAAQLPTGNAGIFCVVYAWPDIRLQVGCFDYGK